MRAAREMAEALPFENRYGPTAVQESGSMGQRRAAAERKAPQHEFDEFSVSTGRSVGASWVAKGSLAV